MIRIAPASWRGRARDDVRLASQRKNPRPSLRGFSSGSDLWSRGDYPPPQDLNPNPSRTRMRSVLPNVHRQIDTGNASASRHATKSTTSPTQASDSSGNGYAAMPHGIASDPRLSPVDRCVILALLHWSYLGNPAENPVRDRARMSDWRLADYAGVSEATVRRSLAKLERIGLIRRDDAPYHPGNMTGRVVVLLWITDPSIVVPPPRHDGPEGNTRPEGRSLVIDPSVQGRSLVIERGAHPCATGARTGERPGRALVSDKEDSPEESKEGLKTKTEESSSSDLSSLSPEGGNPEAIAEAIASVLEAFPGTPEAKIRDLCLSPDASPECVAEAARQTKARNDRPGSEPKGWHYLRATAIGMFKEHGPAGKPASASKSVDLKAAIAAARADEAAKLGRTPREATEDRANAIRQWGRNSLTAHKRDWFHGQARPILDAYKASDRETQTEVLLKIEWAECLDEVLPEIESLLGLTQSELEPSPITDVPEFRSAGLARLAFA
jgi:hypothetical protein